MDTFTYSPDLDRSPSLSSNSDQSSVGSLAPQTPALANSPTFGGSTTPTANRNIKHQTSPFANAANRQSEQVNREPTKSSWSAGHRTGAGTASFDAAKARFAHPAQQTESSTVDQPTRTSSIRSTPFGTASSNRHSYHPTSGLSHSSLPPLATPSTRTGSPSPTRQPYNNLTTPANQLATPTRSPYLAGAFSSPVPTSSPTFARPPSPLRSDQTQSPSANSPSTRALSSALFASRNPDLASPNAVSRQSSFAKSHKRANTLPHIGLQGLPVPAEVDGSGEVAGLNGRVRLSRPAEAPSPFAPSAVFSSSHGLSRQAAGGSPAGTPTRAGTGFMPSQTVKAMERQRKDLVAYEYLCHVAETRDWLTAHITSRSDTSPPLWDESVNVSAFEQSLRSGYALAHLARSLGGDAFGPTIRRIYSDPVRHYNHVDNINIFLDFVQSVGLPEIFRFETVDLFDAKNLPKVTYCVHALALLLTRRGLTSAMDDLRGQVEFSDEEVAAMQRGLDGAGVRMPNFGGLSKAMDRQAETPEERAARERAAAEARAEQDRLEREAAEEAERQRFEEEKRQREEERRIERQRLAELQAQRDEEERYRQAALEAERDEAERRQQAQVAAEREAERRRQERIEAEREAERQRIARVEAEKQAELEWRAQTARELVGLRAHARGVLVRRQFFDNLDALDAEHDSVTQLQAHLRGVLARRQLLNHIRSLRSSEEPLVGFQAQLRGALARRAHQHKVQHFRQARTVTGVSRLQSVARAALVRQRVEVQRQELGFVEPDVVALQAQVRGFQIRQAFLDWRAHVYANEGGAVHLQALVRGLLAKRRYEAKVRFLREHVRSTVALQAAVRSRKQGTQYRQLRMGKSVPVGTVRNFARLLDDSEFDYRGDLQVEELKREFATALREVRAREEEVKDLDIKIALLVKNKITHQDARAARHTHSKLGQGDRNNILSAHSDPFASSPLDKQARHKLELYQQLFNDLQTKPEYLARLCAHAPRLGLTDKAQRRLESTTFTLFGHAQSQREEFLLVKLLQRAVQEEAVLAPDVGAFARADAVWARLFAQYGKGQREYLAAVVGPRVLDLVSKKGLDLRADPVKIHQALIADDESRTGQASHRSPARSQTEAVYDPETKHIFGQRLVALHKATEAMLFALYNSLGQVPYGVRYVGREVYRALRTRFPNADEREVLRAVGHLIYYRFVKPALVAPENYRIVQGVLEPGQRQNLVEVANLLDQIALGRLFGHDSALVSHDSGVSVAEAEAHLVPLNNFVGRSSEQFGLWVTDVINVPDAEVKFGADEYTDATRRPIVFISPNDIYAIHHVVGQHVKVVAPDEADPIRAFLRELGGVPLDQDEDLTAARAMEIQLELTTKLEEKEDPDAPRKALFNRTKRLVLAVLKVRTGADLESILAADYTDEDEQAWAELVAAEEEEDRRAAHAAHRRGPAPPVADDIRALSFHDLRAETIKGVVGLSQLGAVSREDRYQGLVDSIGTDIRTKHKRRVERAAELANLAKSLAVLRAEAGELQMTVREYESYIKQSTAAVHKAAGERKRWSVPWSLQAAHQRRLDTQFLIS